MLDIDNDEWQAFLRSIGAPDVTPIDRERQGVAHAPAWGVSFSEVVHCVTNSWGDPARGDITLPDGYADFFISPGATLAVRAFKPSGDMLRERDVVLCAVACRPEWQHRQRFIWGLSEIRYIGVGRGRSRRDSLPRSIVLASGPGRFLRQRWGFPLAGRGKRGANSGSDNFYIHPDWNRDDNCLSDGHIIALLDDPHPAIS